MTRGRQANPDPVPQADTLNRVALAEGHRRTDRAGPAQH